MFSVAFNFHISRSYLLTYGVGQFSDDSQECRLLTSKLQVCWMTCNEGCGLADPLARLMVSSDSDEEIETVDITNNNL